MICYCFKPLVADSFAVNAGHVVRIGRVTHDGVYGDPGAALQQYDEQKDDLLAGRIPRAQCGGMTLWELVKSLADLLGPLAIRVRKQGEFSVGFIGSER